MKKNNHILLIHLAVLLFGFAGLFGKIINQTALVIVWGRVVFASVSIFFGLKILGLNLKLHFKSDYFKLLSLGLLLAMHWWSFFYSIQISSVAIGLISFATFPVFTSVLEPLFFREKYSLKTIALSFITFAAMFFMVPEINFESKIFSGVLFGLISAVTFALLSIFNRKYVGRINGSVIAFYQDLSAAIILTPIILLLESVKFELIDLAWLALLGTVFTAVAHTAFIKGLEKIKAQKAGIITSLEPVYGIAAAILFLNEYPDVNQIVAGAVILATVIYISSDGRKIS